MSLASTVSARLRHGDSLDAQCRPLDLTSLYQAMHCALDAQASGRQRELLRNREVDDNLSAQR
ncbi:hypothetical protein CXR29_13075 [Brevibacterium linens]|nr:hypothetical protein CXR29_13075 [Brevibacterium linens]